MAVRNSLISHLGLPVSNAFFRNESTGEAVFGAGTSRVMLNVNVGDTITATYNYPGESKIYTGNIVVTQAMLQYTGVNIWIR
ncbi:hypothetical protein [Pedobacter cryoconitis]|uniref:hypothetical protein n=1 Tax=Pedobacter cryoconitis TaxID=188932 RepID=UPI00160DA2BB|nr:hypothetical protein [Pedobacter cryoconitis]